MNIGMIGAGSIGQFLLEKLNEEKLFPGYTITSVFDDREASKDDLQELSTNYNFSVFHDVDSFLKTDIDIVVECANIQVVDNYASRILREKDLLLISIGALADVTLYNELISISKANERKIYLPSGAIGGLDIIRAAKVLDGLNAVTLVSRKPVEALTNEVLKKETVLFEGSAEEAIRKYPQNANVAIILSVAGIGPKNTLVKIIADPDVDKNIHTIHASGDFGKVDVTIENNPSPTNPKTSYLTALSILSSLKALDEEITIG